jgi:hypothetical protein
MNQRLLKMAYPIAWATILGFGLPVPSAAQDATPTPKITPLWTVTENFCPPNGDCYQRRELSTDGEHLFVYIVPTSTMYVYAKGQDKVAIYPIARPARAYGSYDHIPLGAYLPLNDHTILYNDPDFLTKDALMRLDLLTGESHIFGTEIALESCRNYRFTPEVPTAFFHYLPTLDALLVCRNPKYGAVSPPNIVSTVDLKSGQLTDIARLRDGNYGYINVIGGRDGGIYLEPGPSDMPPDGTKLIMRWNADTSTWDRIEFPDSNLPENDVRSFEFIGVDRQSNFYFQSNYDYSEGRKQSLLIAKIDRNEKLLYAIKQDQLGWNPEFIGLDATGQMIILNRMTLPSSNTTVDVISRYEFDMDEKKSS